MSESKRFLMCIFVVINIGGFTMCHGWLRAGDFIGSVCGLWLLSEKEWSKRG